jgi:seryl-tRNA synthetase
MIDINLVREHPEVIIKDFQKRGMDNKIPWFEELRRLDVDWKNLKLKVDDLRHSRNKISQEIAQAKKQGKDTKDLMKRAAEIPKMLAEEEQKMQDLEKEIRLRLMTIPNILHESVPIGASENDNKVVREFGKKPKFSFEVKSHVDLLESLDLADIERAGKISGARFWFLKNELLLLDLALRKYAIDFMYNKGFSPVEPPFMMNKKSYEGVVDLSDFENVMYKIEDEDLYLIATSEHPLTSMFMNEILEEGILPIKMTGISTNFRKEAGSHGKDTKGIFRGHQFNKIEQIILCKPEESWDFHEKLIKNAEEFFKSLGLYCRTVSICTADIGTVAAKKYDIEAWMPAQQKFREVVSCSNCTEYQARRLNVRFRTKEGNKFIHTLNSTCVATSRALVAILENNQKKDGTIKVPKVLVPYMNGMEVIGKKKQKKK